MQIELVRLTEKFIALEEKVSDLKKQEARTFSHYDSERQFRDAVHLTHSDLSNSIKNNTERIKNHDDLLYNKGEGLVYKVKEFDKSIDDITKENKKCIDDITKENKEWVTTYNDVFYNRDHGLVYKVKEFDKRIQNSNSVWNKISTWAGVIISAIALYIAFTK